MAKNFSIPKTDLVFTFSCPNCGHIHKLSGEDLGDSLVYYMDDPIDFEWKCENCRARITISDI